MAGRRLLPTKTEIDFSGSLRGKLAEKFAAEAERRKQSPADLAVDILETVVKDDLFAAVLDT